MLGNDCKTLVYSYKFILNFVQNSFLSLSTVSFLVDVMIDNHVALSLAIAQAIVLAVYKLCVNNERKVARLAVGRSVSFCRLHNPCHTGHHRHRAHFR